MEDVRWKRWLRRLSGIYKKGNQETQLDAAGRGRRWWKGGKGRAGGCRAFPEPLYMGHAVTWREVGRVEAGAVGRTEGESVQNKMSCPIRTGHFPSCCPIRPDAARHRGRQRRGRHPGHLLLLASATPRQPDRLPRHGRHLR